MVVIVTQTERPKSVRNIFVIEVFGGVFMLSICMLDFSVVDGAFVGGLSQISSFFSDIKSQITLETAAIFFLENLFLKQGISMEYVMVNFIFMGLLDLRGARTEKYKTKNSCTLWDSILPVPCTTC